MQARRRFLVLMTALLAVAATSLSTDEHDRRSLDRLRGDPERYLRLLGDLQRFNACKPEKRERIRLLDRALQEETSASQSRFLRAGHRYADWFARLSPEQQRQISASSTKDKRLELIKEFRRQQWFERLPRPLRDRLANASAPERQEFIEQYHAKERLARLDQWDVRPFVAESLGPRLLPDEKARLHRAEGQWPLYPRALVELADKNAFKLLMPLRGVSKIEDLPEEFQKRLTRIKGLEMGKKQLNQVVGKWPEFALALSEFARKHKMQPPPLGPCRPKDFPDPIREFIAQKLMNWNASPLDKEERSRLKKSEGYWPLYPTTMLELSRKHRLSIPGVSLPGPVEFWDKFREAAAPEPSVVNDSVLFDFALSELTAEEREALRFTTGESAGRDRLQQEYIRRHPDEWQQLQQSDQQKRDRKKRATD